jgi:hypothetical protein
MDLQKLTSGADKISERREKIQTREFHKPVFLQTSIAGFSTEFSVEFLEV